MRSPRFAPPVAMGFFATLWPALPVAWVAVCLLGNYRLADGVYVSQLLLIGVAVTWAVIAILARTDLVPLVEVLFLIVALAALGVLLHPGQSPRLLEEFGKLTMVLVGAMALSRLPELSRDRLIHWLPFLTAIGVLGSYFLGIWDYYDLVLHRFGVPMWGASNTTAYVLGIGLLAGHYVEACQRDRDEAFYRRLPLYLAMATMAVALVATYSRGGIIAYGAGLLYLSRRRPAAILVVSILVLTFAFYSGWVVDLQRFDLITDFRATGGSGRIAVWSRLLQKLSSDPSAILFGFGPGSIGFRRGASIVESAHSMYIELVYQFGIVGSLVLVIGFFRLGRIRGAIDPSQAWTDFRRALTLHFLVGGLVDTYVGAAQLSWLVALQLGIIIASSAPEAKGIT